MRATRKKLYLLICCVLPNSLKEPFPVRNRKVRSRKMSVRMTRPAVKRHRETGCPGMIVAGYQQTFCRKFATRF